MRWQMVDAIDAFAPWTSIRGRKTVSLEEYNLLAPLGRKGSLPESLVLESCVQLCRWLVAAGSDFRRSCLLAGVDAFTIDRRVGVGDVLTLSARVLSAPEDGALAVGCEAAVASGPCARGRLALALLPLEDLCDRGDLATLWRELRHAET